MQVPPKENLSAIKNALLKGGNRNVTTKEFPNLNHLFQECKTGSSTEYSAIEQTISPTVLKAHTPVALRLMIQTGRDIMACPVWPGPYEHCQNFNQPSWCLNRHSTTPQPRLTKNKKDRMQQIIKKPDQILIFLIPENRGCFWVSNAMLFTQ